MKALAILAAFLLAASPAVAIPPPAPHPGPAPHPLPQPHPGPQPHPLPQPHPEPTVIGGGNGHRGNYGGASLYAPFVPAFPAYADVQPADDLPPPMVIPAPPEAYCPPPMPARLRHVGPRIIYIGAQPKVNVPQIIYGTD